MKRVGAWFAVLAVGFIVYRFAASFQNPWAVVTAQPTAAEVSRLVDQLPAYTGCGESCK